MKEYLISILFFIIGAFFFGCNFIFYYWLHGDFERYLWIINQPWPLSHLGGSSVQLLIYIAFTFTGLILLATGIYIQNLINKK